jgi:AcrR family transcriptional regulator
MTYSETNVPPSRARVATPRRRVRRAPRQSRQHILRAATREFVTHGFAGARVNRIVKKAGSNPRMIYHYFGCKSQLYLAVLEEALGGLRREELRIDVEHLDPREGLLQLFDFMAHHFENNRNLVRLLQGENVLRAKYMRKSARVPEMSSPVLAMIEQLIARGTKAGRWTHQLDGLRLYILMVALSQFHLSNGYTLSVTFGRDLFDAAWRKDHASDARRMVAAFLNG